MGRMNGWMHAMDVLMDVWDECVRWIDAMDACDGCIDGCMGWIHVIDL